jgi:hypothetical protein
MNGVCVTWLDEEGIDGMMVSHFKRLVIPRRGLLISVSNSVLKMQYRGRYNTGISKMLNNGIDQYFFTKYTGPYPYKKSGQFGVKTAVNVYIII